MHAFTIEQEKETYMRAFTRERERERESERERTRFKDENALSEGGREVGRNERGLGSVREVSSV